MATSVLAANGTSAYLHYNEAGRKMVNPKCMLSLSVAISKEALFRNSLCIKHFDY